MRSIPRDAVSLSAYAYRLELGGEETGDAVAVDQDRFGRHTVVEAASTRSLQLHVPGRVAIAWCEIGAPVTETSSCPI
jgi:hypothetical protein